MTTLALNTNPSHREPIAGYVLQERIGAGGYGEVWKAAAPGGLLKAVKIVFGDVGESRASRELKALERIRQVSHPMILSIERIEVVDNHLVVITELAEMSLRDRFEQHVADGRAGIPREELLGYLRDAADALDFLYEKHSLQHLDIKPENLLLVGGRVKVADFGMIKDLQDASVSLVSGLTPLYAAPELFDGAPSRHSDQYGLAVLYQEMLTGRPPFDGRTPAQIAKQQMQGTPNLSPLPRLDQPVVSRALAKHPTQRFTCCRAFVDHLTDQGRASSGSGQFSAERRSGPRPRSEEDTQQITDKTVPSATVFLPCPAAVTVLPPLDTADSLGIATPLLQPILVIGLGGSANHLLAAIRSQLTERYGCMSRIPSIRFLAIDSDEQALSRNLGIESCCWGIGESVLAPLRPANDYREDREAILEWLSRRWLFNIPRSQKTEGMRPLGRLALVGQFRNIRRAISESLRTIRDPDSLAITAASTGFSVDASGATVLVVGNLSGGTAGGGLLDLAYSVRHELAQHELPDDDVRLLMLHSTGRRSNARDLSIANTVTSLREVFDYLRPKGLYPGEPTCGIPTYEHDRAHFSQMRFVHLGDELDDHEFDEQLRQLGDYLSRELVADCRQVLRKLVPGPKVAEDTIFVETLGCMSLQRLLGRLPSQIAAHVARVLLESWLSPQVLASEGKQVRLGDLDGILAAEQTAEADRHLEVVAQQVARALKLERGPLEALVQGLANSALGEESESYWNKLLDRVLDPQTGLAVGMDVDFAIRKVVGRPDATEQQSAYTPLRMQIETRSGDIGRQLSKTVHDCLKQILDSPGTRIFSAIGLLDSLRARLNGLADILRGEAAALDLPLTKLAVMAVEDPAGSGSKRPVDVALNRRKIWLEYARMQEQWAVLCGTESIVRFTLRGLVELNEQLLELARRIRGIRPEAFVFDSTEDQGPEQQQMLTWARTHVRTWVQSLDRQIGEQLQAYGISLSTLRNPNHSGWGRFGELLRDAAQRVVVSAAIQRSLRDSQKARPDESSSGLLTQWINDAQPRMAACGGEQRWAILFGNEDESVRTLVRDQVRITSGQPGTELSDPQGSLQVCCQMHRVPLENIIRTLIGTRHEIVPIAERLHARIDVPWSKIVD